MWVVIIGKWDDYHIGCLSRPDRIVIGKGRMLSNGAFKYKDRSDDRTEEVMMSVIGYLSRKNNKRDDDRGYCGSELPGVGKLLFIEDGYDFMVYKKGEL